MNSFIAVSKPTHPVSICLGYRALERKAANAKRDIEGRRRREKPKAPYSVRIDAEAIPDIKQSIKRKMATVDAHSRWGPRSNVYVCMKRSAPNKAGQIWDKVTFHQYTDNTDPFRMGYVKEKGGTTKVADIVAFNRPSIVFDSDSSPVTHPEDITERSIIKVVAQPNIIKAKSGTACGFRVVLELLQIRVVELEGQEIKPRLPEKGTLERAIIDNSWKYGKKE